MKTVTAIILTVILSACGGGELTTVIGEADMACRNAAGVDIACK
jgi:hypothetical protein